MTRENILWIASTFHTGQTYGCEPYVNHLMRVANPAERLAPFYHVDPEYTWAVGILHDLLEDTDASYLDIQGRVPVEVIKEMVHLDKTAYSSYSEYIWSVSQYSLAKVVKIADLIDNLGHQPRKNNIQKYLDALKELL